MLLVVLYRIGLVIIRLSVHMQILMSVRTPTTVNMGPVSTKRVATSVSANITMNSTHQELVVWVSGNIQEQDGG